MTTGPDDVHVLLGAYVLGGLSDADHHAFTEHLRTCRECQAELGQVSGLPRLLDLAGPDGGPHLAPGSDASADPLPPADGGALATLLDEVARRRHRRRSWLTAAAAAAAVALFVAGAWLGPTLTGSGEPVASPPVTHVVAAASPGSSVRVDVALVTKAWGTQLDLDCEDMPTEGSLVLYVVDDSGRATATASWRATSTGYSRVIGSTALRPSEIRVVEVRTEAGRVIASART